MLFAAWKPEAGKKILNKVPNSIFFQEGYIFGANGWYLINTVLYLLVLKAAALD